MLSYEVCGHKLPDGQKQSLRFQGFKWESGNCISCGSPNVFKNPVSCISIFIPMLNFSVLLASEECG